MRAMTETRAFTSADSASVAELARVVRSRPKDCIDPFPPSTDLEVLADAGARGKGGDVRRPRVVDGEDGVIAYGALDYSEDLHRAHFVGPIVHPGHRHKGFGRLVVQSLLDQARAGKQREVRATVGGMNQGGRALLEKSGFKLLACNSLLRIARPETFGELHLDGTEVRRATYDDWEELHEFVRKLVPRNGKQTRSLLKTNQYIVLLAYRRKQIIGFAEVDLRQAGLAVLEHLDGPPNMLHKGLGNLLLSESIRCAFESPEIEAFELVAVGNEPTMLANYEAAGFERLHELLVYELKL